MRKTLLLVLTFSLLQSQSELPQGSSGGTSFTGGAVTAPITYPDGSAAAPSVANNGDEDTGVYWCADNAVCISTGGTERFRITTTELTLTLPLLFPAGTVSAPGMAWSADADGSGTGWYRSAANTISGTCNGSECFRVDTAEMRVRNTIRDLAGDQKLVFSTVSGNDFSNQASGTLAGMFHIANTNAASGTGRVLQIQSGGTTHITLGPGFYTEFTDSSGSPGAATINKASGISAIATGASTVVITNNQVTATSRVLITNTSANATCTGAPWIVTVAAGSFTVTAPANCTVAAATFAWFVVS